MKPKPDVGHIILRFALSFVFLMFGIKQLYAPTMWMGYVPEAIGSMVSPFIVVLLNGALEIFLGLMLLFGLHTRIVSLLLGLHLIGIAIPFGLSPIGVRDFGLAFATLSLVFMKPDMLSLDIRKKRSDIDEPEPVVFKADDDDDDLEDHSENNSKDDSDGDDDENDEKRSQHNNHKNKDDDE